jgi:hypothetical protein
VWCGVIGDKLIGPYIFPQRLTGAIYTNFLRDELPALLENVPLQTRLQMYYQHDGAPPHFSQFVRQCWACVMYSAWNPKDNYDMSANIFVVQFNGFMSLTS